MNGGRIIGLKRGQPAEDELLLDAPVDERAWDGAAAAVEIDPEDYEEADEASGAARWPRIAKGALVLAAIGWTGWFALAVVAAGAPPAPAEAARLLGLWCAPMIVLGIAALLLLRTSRAEARRFAGTAGLLRTEALLLDRRLARMTAELSAARGEISAQADMLQELGARATQRLQAASTTIADRAEAFAGSAGRAAAAGDALGDRLTALDAAMPVLEDRAARIAETMRDDADAIDTRITGLEERIAALHAAAAEARQDIAAATKSLTAQLGQLREAAEGATGALDGMGVVAAARIDTALVRVDAALEATRKGTDAQGAALEALVERSGAALGTTAASAVATFDAHADAIAARLDTLQALIERQRDGAAALDVALGDSIDELTEKFAALETGGIDRNERLGAAMTLLAAEAERLERALAGGNGTAEALIGRSERLLLALDSGVREIDETLPLALARLDARLHETQTLMGGTAPEIEKMEAVADALLGSVREAAALMAAHGEAVAGLLDESGAGLSLTAARLSEVEQALSAADAGARRLSDGAGPQLIEALLRVRETAEAAGEHARAAIGRAIPEAAHRLSEEAARAMEGAIADKVAAQMTEIAGIAENAVRAAHLATDRLMRQLLTITESSASLERRVAEAEHAAEARDRDSFARRAAMLIESLNSTAIDVTKLLTTDVSDTSWSGYLKGDRGVFTRRAVRLLDAGGARAIAALYQDDAEFAEHVNRYIHDFEAMLRNILSVRDGSALGVTLLSSDMGKLYVALAQAIERLRT